MPRRTALPAARALPRGGPCARESTPKHRTRSRIAAMSGPFPLYDNAALRQAEARAASRLGDDRSEEHTSELQSLMRISYAVFCLKKKTNTNNNKHHTRYTCKTTNQ